MALHEKGIHEYYAEDQLLKDQHYSNKTKIIKRKKNCGEVLNHVLRNITVEPCVFLFIVAIMIGNTSMQNLNLEKACRVNLQYNKTICDALRAQHLQKQNDYERETQKLLATALTWRTYISVTVPCILVLFTGAFSDKTGLRKFFICIPLSGQVLACANYILNVYFFEELNLQVLVLSDALIEGLSGGWGLCFLSSFAFISSITTERNRTFRLGLVNFHLTVAFPIGMGSGGVLLRNLGYYGSFGICGCLHMINLLYIIFVLKDPLQTKEQREHSGKGVIYLIRTFFDIKNVKYTMKVVYKKAPNNRRTRLCVLLAVVCVLFGPLYGEITVMYMITRYRFNWDEVKFSIFQTYNFITHTIGTMFCILVLSKYLQWHDSLLGIMSTLSKVAASFVYAFAPNERIFYVAPLIEILNGSSLLSMRAIITKLVEPNELGSISSIISLTENLMPLLYVPLYTQVYVATIGFLPGTVFLVGAGLTVPAVCVLSYLYYEHRKQLRSMRSDDHSKVTASYS